MQVAKNLYAPRFLSTSASDGLQGMLESLLTQLFVKIEAIYGRHRQTSKDVFEIHSGDITSYLMLNTITSAGASLAHSLRYRFHHPEFVFDKLSTLAGGLLAFSRRYAIGTFPAYEHEDAALGFMKLDAIIRDLIEVSLSSRYHVIPLIKDMERGTHYDAVLDPAMVDGQTMLGLAVSADVPALELVAAVPLRFKISSPASIDDLLRHALKRRVSWITPDQAGKLLAELPDHQREIVLFALATGLRQGNVTALRWSQLDLVRKTGWIGGDQAKCGEDIHISLNELAIEVLQRQIGKHPERVFTYAGRPVTWVNTRGWRSALVRAGISDFRWHDLRHTWASWLVQNGTPLYALQEMGGWKSSEMVRRYAHLAPAQMAKHAAIIDSLLRDTNTAQHDGSAKQEKAAEARKPLM